MLFFHFAFEVEQNKTQMFTSTSRSLNYSACTALCKCQSVGLYLKLYFDHFSYILSILRKRYKVMN